MTPVDVPCANPRTDHRPRRPENPSAHRRATAWLGAQHRRSAQPAPAGERRRGGCRQRRRRKRQAAGALGNRRGRGGEATTLQADEAFAANLAESTRCWFGRRRRSPKPGRPAETAGGTRNRWSTISIGNGMDASPSGAPSLRKPTVCDRCCRRSSPPTPGTICRCCSTRLARPAAGGRNAAASGCHARAHLAAVNLGLKPSPLSVAAIARAIRGCWRSSTASSRPPLGLKEHDRLALARTMMERRLVGRRSSSHLPGLVELVMSRPLISAGMVAEALEVTSRAALRIV